MKTLVMNVNASETFKSASFSLSDNKAGLWSAVATAALALPTLLSSGQGLPPTV